MKAGSFNLNTGQEPFPVLPGDLISENGNLWIVVEPEQLKLLSQSTGGYRTTEVWKTPSYSFVRCIKRNEISDTKLDFLFCNGGEHAARIFRNGKEIFLSEVAKRLKWQL